MAGPKIARDMYESGNRVEYDFKRAEFHKCYLSIGSEEYAEAAIGIKCALPKYKKDYWEWLKYGMNNILYRCKALFHKPRKFDTIKL